MDAAPAEVISAVINASAGEAKYATETDRESAYELLTARLGASAAATQQAAAEKAAADAAKAEQKAAPASRSRAKADKNVVEEVLTSAPVRQFARTAGRELVNSISRSIFGVRKR